MVGHIEIDTLASARFGVVAARLADGTAPLDAVNNDARDARVDLLTTRVDASDIQRVHALEAAGFRLMDTLVVFERALHLTRDQAAGGVQTPVQRQAASTEQHSGASENSGLTENSRSTVYSHEAMPRGHVIVRAASAEDINAVSRIAHAAFRGYIGHFHADPKLDRRAADGAYVEWAENNVRSCSASSPVLVACLSPRVSPQASADGEVSEVGSGPVGFLCFKQNGPKTLEITLNAVYPKMHKQGVYTALLLEAIEHARRSGAERLIISTQVNNYAVQRVWCRLEFMHFQTLYTFHKWCS